MDDTASKVMSILQNIKEGDSSIAEVNKQTPKLGTQKKGNAKESETKIRGKPKSGRFWKTNKERFSSINKNKGLKQPLEKKDALRNELKRVKELSRQEQEKRQQQIEERKQRRRDNMKRTEENKRKSEIVQVITNTAKVKRMRKKQLRFIQKRDTNDLNMREKQT